jgi:hydrogenase maturation protease
VSRTLIAGVGNVFFGDDGFGCAVARRLAREPLPEGVSVVDFGIRGVHLAYELTSGWDRAIIVDAVSRGGDPGTLYVIDPALDLAAGAVADGHGLDLGAVLAMTRTLGAPPPGLRVVGCEAAELVERIGLSDTLEQAVEAATTLLRHMLEWGAAAPPPRRTDHETWTRG